jgi:hypothetical protein
MENQINSIYLSSAFYYEFTLTHVFAKIEQYLQNDWVSLKNQQNCFEVKRISKHEAIFLIFESNSIYGTRKIKFLLIITKFMTDLFSKKIKSKFFIPENKTL